MAIITKTTVNFAKRHNLDVTIENFGEVDQICVWEANNDCEWMFSYTINANGSFNWYGNVYLAQDIKEELPATINDEKHLRAVLKFIAENI